VSRVDMAVPSLAVEKVSVARESFGRSEERVRLFGHSGVPGDTDLTFGVMEGTKAEKVN
jgi:hypothetical protein